MTVHSFKPEFLVAGTKVPLSGFDVTLGTYGSVGHCDVMSSRQLLRGAGVDLVKVTADAPSSVEVGLTVAIDGATTKIFGGEYVSARWTFDEDVVRIHCRDFAGLLVDQKRVLSAPAQAAAEYLAPGQAVNASGISYQNQTLSQLVTAIAKMFGMKPVLHIKSANDPEVGSILGSSDTVYMPTPKSLWGILCRLARETGYEVHVTPNRELVFGLPGAGATPIKLCYKVFPTPAGAVPCRGPSIEHNPRRNLTFRVLVLSYDPAKAQLTRGEAYVVGTNMGTSGNAQVKAGAWSGSEAAKITSNLAEGGGHLQIPLYTIRVDGLTQAQAQTRATAIAADIAKRELILTATVDMLPGVVPLNALSIAGDVEAEFAGHQYYVNACTHRYALPKSGGGMGTVETTLTALDVQVQGVGDSVTTGGANA